MMRVRIHPSFIIYLLYVTFSASLSACLSIVLTLAAHEAGHYAACRLVGEAIDQLTITPFGGVMTYRQGSTSFKGVKGVLVHAAGPIGNYIFLLSLGIPVVQHRLSCEFMRHLILCNTSMLLVNLLPMLPLDGGHIVFCIGYYFFPIARLVRWLSALGIAAGAAGVMLAVYGLIFRQILNCSLMIVSVYLVICAGKGRSALLTENICAVIHERLAQPFSIKRIEHYRIAADTTLLALTPYLKEGVCVSFFFSESDRQCELTEYMFCQALLENPSATVQEAFLYHTNIGEKREKFCKKDSIPS